jgi:signal peptidase
VEKKSMARTAGQKIVAVIGVLLCIVLIPILIANVTIIVKSFAFPDKVPSFLGYKPFIDLSDSMYPAIKAGDLVIVRETDTNKLAKGDVIAYREGKSVITHRIIDVKTIDGTRQFITKGDNNNTEDRLPVLSSDVEGKLVIDIPKLGNTALFMQTPVGMIVFIALPLLLFILYDFIRRKLYDRPKLKSTEQLEDEIRKMRQKIATLENEKQTGSTNEAKASQMDEYRRK